MTFKELYDLGFERGHNCASWVDVPEDGMEIPLDVDWVGYHVVTSENRWDVMDLLAHASEVHDRCFSPFELTASEINSSFEDDVTEAWHVYEEGITAGIQSNIQKRALDWDE